MIQRRIYATPLYPGFPAANPGKRVWVASGAAPDVIPLMPLDDSWYAVMLEVEEGYKVLGDWVPERIAPHRRYIFIGTVLSAAEVETQHGADSALVYNMRDYGCDHLVLCRADNHQPLREHDQVLSETELQQMRNAPLPRPNPRDPQFRLGRQDALREVMAALEGTGAQELLRARIGELA